MSKVSKPQIKYRHHAFLTDIDHVKRIVNSTGFFSPSELDIALELVADHMAHGEHSGYFFLFAELDGQVAGYTCYGPIPGTQLSWDLYWIAVDQTLQSKGIGRELLRLTEEKIKEMCGSRVYIETSSRTQYESTRNFYLRNNYVLVSELTDFYSPGDHKDTYLKVL
jgi:GNAT superfamily N-acetyltransferase